MSRTASSQRGPRPSLGAHLLALRQTAGLTQIELAHAIGVNPANIAYWEWSATPPRSNVLPAMAAALGVRVELLLEPPTRRGKRALASEPARRPGPAGRLQKVFEKAAALPRRQQDKVVEIVTAMVEQYARKAS